MGKLSNQKKTWASSAGAQCMCVSVTMPMCKLSTKRRYGLLLRSPVHTCIVSSKATHGHPLQESHCMLSNKTNICSTSSSGVQCSEARDSYTTTESCVPIISKKRRRAKSCHWYTSGAGCFTRIRTRRGRPLAGMGRVGVGVWGAPLNPCGLSGRWVV